MLDTLFFLVLLGGASVGVLWWKGYIKFPSSTKTDIKKIVTDAETTVADLDTVLNDLAGPLIDAIEKQLKNEAKASAIADMKEKLRSSFFPTSTAKNQEQK